MTGSLQAHSFFGVDLDLVNVGVEVRVNEIPIYSDLETGQLTVELPSPESVINGVNALGLIVKPPRKGREFLDAFEGGAYVSAKFFRQDNDLPKEYLAAVRLELNSEGKLKPVAASTLSEKEPVEVDLGGKASEITVFATIDSPFPPWAWQLGLNIENNQNNYDSLLEAYREVYNAMEKNDQQLLKQLYAKRAEEIAIAYHLNGVDAGHEKISTGKDVLNPNIKLRDFFEKDTLELQLIANGKMARLITPTGLQPIFFLQENPTLLHLHKFMFYKNTKNEWVMIR